MTASVQVEELKSELPNPDLWGSFKVKGAEGGRLELIGWALGTRNEVEKIEVVADGRVVASTSPRLPRAEVGREFPDRAQAAQCGFEVTIEAKGKGTSRLELRAVLDDGTEAAMGELRVLAPSRRWSNVFRRS
jgi:hypothetical protein